MGSWDFCLLSAGKDPHAHKIPRFRAGYFGFGGGGSSFTFVGTKKEMSKIVLMPLVDFCPFLPCTHRVCNCLDTFRRLVFLQRGPFPLAPVAVPLCKFGLLRLSICNFTQVLHSILKLTSVSGNFLDHDSHIPPWTRMLQKQLGWQFNPAISCYFRGLIHVRAQSTRIKCCIFGPTPTLFAVSHENRATPLKVSQKRPCRTRLGGCHTSSKIVPRYGGVSQLQCRESRYTAPPS